MKRAAIIQAVTTAMRGNNFFPDERCVNIAQALGVTVEPDVEPLPQRLSLTRDPMPTRRHGEQAHYDFTLYAGDGPSRQFARLSECTDAEAQALVAAYNSAQLDAPTPVAPTSWRTDDPPDGNTERDRWYLVKSRAFRQDVGVLRWNASLRRWDTEDLNAFEDAVTGWQPLPE
jgi:hypothetical protein